MERCGSTYIFLTLLLGIPFCGALTGCGPSATSEVVTNQTETVDEETSEPSKSAEPPDPAEAAAVVREFLEAIKTGDETKSNDLITPLARERTAAMDMAVAPMGSDAASFTVGEVELPEEGEGQLAHVASTWTDIDDDGEQRTYEILWVLRHEEQGWRIGGMATKVFEDQPPLLLNFEDPEDMRRKQQLAEAEGKRREEAQERPVEQPEAQSEDVADAEPAPPQRQATKATRPPRKK